MNSALLRLHPFLNIWNNNKDYVFITGLGCLFVYSMINIVLPYIRRKDLQKQIQLKLSATRSYKNKLKQLSEEQTGEQLTRNKEITETHIIQLLEALKTRKYTAKEVLRAYQFKALEADEKTNCITEFIKEAETTADELDQIEDKGVLHGLPISVKDNIYVKGYDCTLGLVKFLGKPVDEDATIIKVLKQAGANPFVKTNVPQTLLNYNCCNPIFGVTCNPLSSERTPGGSSGGEAALIALGGSLVGLGSDIGGSVRIPSHMCGISCLKPTLNRISGKNIRRSMDGVAGVLGVPAPMSKTVDGLYVTLQALLSQKMYSLDPEVVPIPFREKIYQSSTPLKIGYYDDDGIITPTPGCQRAVHETKIALEKLGHEVIPFSLPKPWKAFYLCMALILADGGKTLKSRWNNDVVENTVKFTQIITSLPKWLRKLISWLIQSVSPRVSIMAAETGRTAGQLWETMKKREDYIKLFFDQWKEMQLDAIIVPGFPIPAPPHSCPTKLSAVSFTTMLFNFLNLPVGTFPVTQETEEDQEKLKDYRSDDFLFKLMKRATIGAVGMPIAIQIVSLPWQEEVVLRIMRELEKKH